MPMASASNSCAREKLASASFDLASASAPTSGSLMTSVTTRPTSAACLRLLLADGGVARDHVTHFVRQHRGKLGFVVGERDQPAGHVKLAGRQREGVDRLRIEHRDLVVQIGPLRRRHQAFDGLLDHGLQSRIVVDAAIGGEDALMLAQHRGRHVADVSAGLAGGGSDACGSSEGGDAVQAASTSGSTAQARQCRHGEAEASPILQPPRGHRPSINSLATRLQCSVAFHSLAVGKLDLFRPRRLDPGPPRSSIHPRTRIRRPASVFGSIPAAVKLRSFLFKIVTVKSVAPPPSEIYVDGGPAFADRNHLALDQRETALLGQHRGGVLGVK